MMDQFEQESQGLFYPQTQCLELLCDGVIRTPGKAYDHYVAERERRGLPWPRYYFSTTITSGGFLRDENVPFAEGMQANVELAKDLTDAVVREHGIDPQTVVLPSELGKVTGWRQIDYLILWYHVLWGARPEHALAVDIHFGHSIFQGIAERMENKRLTRDQRLQAYRDFVAETWAMLMNTEEGYAYEYQHQVGPVLVPTLDTDFSLGCITEQFWTPPPVVRELTADINHRPANTAQTLGASILKKASPGVLGLRGHTIKWPLEQWW